ncbi:MAG: LysM peptidoglycan-binding domain-containing protein [Phycisphaerae bacterium]|nr:LysM peptidoglycan-binding domain-containing protein [Phycisphaerae bacterium]
MNSGTKLIVAGVLAIFAAVGLYYGFAPQTSTAGPKPPAGVTPASPGAKPTQAAPKPTATPPATATTRLASGAPGAGPGAPTAPPVGPRPSPEPVVDPLARSANRPEVDPSAPATSGGKGDAPSSPAGTSPTAPLTPANTPAATPITSPAVNPRATANSVPGVGNTGAPTNPPVVSPPPVPAGGSGPGPKPVTPLGPTTPTKLAAGETTHLVLEGETMSSIAEKYYGDKNKWQLIAKANPLIDPRGMKLGTKLVIPADAPKAATALTAPAAKPTVPAVAPASVTANAASGEKLHTVAAGETLMAIARNYYGSAGLWDVIYEANKATIGDEPESLKAGMKLVIPKKPA